jgi:hypothetical protein
MALGALEEFERSYFDLRWHLDPVAATLAGLTAYDDRFGRYSPPVLAPHLAALKSLALAAEEIAADGLETEIDRTALLNDIRVTIWQFEQDRPQAKNPEFWLTHLFSGLHGLLRRGDRGAAQNAAAMAGRLEDVAALLDDARASLVEPVRMFAETALQMCPGGVVLIRDIRALYGHGPAGERVAAAAERAGAALAAFEHDLDRWVESGGEHFALGEDGFNFLLHYQHALRDTAPELWRYGSPDRRRSSLIRPPRRGAGRSGHGGAGGPAAGRSPGGGGLVSAYARDGARAGHSWPVPAMPFLRCRWT